MWTQDEDFFPVNFWSEIKSEKFSQKNSTTFDKLNRGKIVVMKFETGRIPQVLSDLLAAVAAVVA